MHAPISLPEHGYTIAEVSTCGRDRHKSSGSPHAATRPILAPFLMCAPALLMSVRFGMQDIYRPPCAFGRHTDVWALQGALDWAWIAWARCDSLLADVSINCFAGLLWRPLRTMVVVSLSI